MDINTEIDMYEARYVDVMDTWTGLEDVVVQATNQAMALMEDDKDDDFLLKAHAISVFVSRIQYIFHKKLEEISAKIEVLKQKKEDDGICIPIGK